jgi:hypothetical protein
LIADIAKVEKVIGLMQKDLVQVGVGFGCQTFLVFFIQIKLTVDNDQVHFLLQLFITEILCIG